MTDMHADFDSFNRSLMVAIPIFNRVGHWLRLLESVHASRDVLHSNLYAFDDASYAFEPALLRQHLHPQSHLLGVAQHSGDANKAIERIFRFFLQSEGHQHLLLLDCGLIVADDWLHAAWQGRQRCGGLVSLLNAPVHQAVLELPGAPPMVQKQSLGLAGTVWSRALVADVLQHVPLSPRYAWDICRYLSPRLPLCSLLESRVQNVGVDAHSLRAGRFEYGVGFLPGNAVAAQILARENEKMIFELVRR